MGELSVRPFVRDHDDYDALARLWNALHPNMPRAGSIWRARHGKDMHREAVGLYVALRGERLVGFGQHDPCDVAGEPGQLCVTHVARPEERGGEVLDALHASLLKAVAPLDPPSLLAYAVDTKPWMMDFYRGHGFESGQRTASSRLRLAAFDPVPFASSLQRVAEQGYELLSARELAAADPSWMPAYHTLDKAIMQDIPFLGPTHEEPFERFVERTKDPTSWNPDATFVARELATGELVGLALVHTYGPIPGYGFAGMTGVLRAHRRKGLACALKVATLAWCRSHGVERLVALNEVDNPMLRLNRALGFETQHVQHTMLRRLRAAAS